LNGRLDLAQAEAVLDTIQAKTAGSLRVAHAQRRGGLSRAVESIRQDLLVALAHVEAGLDFAEEDIAFVGRDELRSILTKIDRRLADLLDTAKSGRIWREGAVVAIVGRPNVGKSSLMNALTGTDRAIVTAIPGTTRDLLDAWIHIKGLPIRLVDTAGIRETIDPVEQEGVRRSQGAADDADLIVALLDRSAKLVEEDRALLGGLSEKNYLVALNKSDLPSQLTENGWVTDFLGKRPPLSISAATGTGLDDLREQIYRRLTSGGMEASDGVCVTHLRHSSALRRAQEGIDRAMAAVQDGLTGEFVAADLRNAADALGEITGAITTDEILNRIFSEFCIGK
jgi:tRNA modification GTPase